MDDSWCVIEFLIESLGEDMVRVHGPFDSEQEATEAEPGFQTRATRKTKVVQMGWT